jgi:hypothetical protein
MKEQPKNMETDNRTSISIKGEYDYELIISRESPVLWENLELLPYSIPAYYDVIEDTFYLNFTKADLEHFLIISESEKEKLISTKMGPEFLAYPESDIRKKLKFSTNKLFWMPGVKGQLFSLHFGKRAYWRFLFFKEQFYQVSDFLLNTTEERKNIENAELQIDYLGAAHDLQWYLKKYRYGREVIRLKILEKLSEEYLKNVPHYSHPFHFDRKSPDFGNGIVSTIRFSNGKCESKGSLKNQILIRDGETIVTEDTRIGFSNVGFSNVELLEFKNRVFVPLLESHCDYNGIESISTYIIDKLHLNKLLSRIHESNEVTKDLVQLSVLSVEDFYLPHQDMSRTKVEEDLKNGNT